MAAQHRQFATLGIILSRTDFGEADRILTFITPDYGKIKAIAKGVRRAGAKLAGAIELFCVSELTLVAGRGDMSTVISARLARNYGHIVKDIKRTETAYELLRILNKSTEEKTEESFFTLIDKSLAALDDSAINQNVVEIWFRLQLLKLSGHAPNLKTGITGDKLIESTAYNFDLDKMCFAAHQTGEFDAAQIKFLRVGLAAASPQVVQRVQDAGRLAESVQTVIHSMLARFFRV